MAGRIRKVSGVALFFAGMLLSLVDSATAVPIINIGPSATNTKSNLVLTGKELQTVDSFGRTATQGISVDFDGDLAGLNDIIDGARLALDGILLMGTANVNNDFIDQKTQGGSFAIYGDATDASLLLGGNIKTGSISGERGQNQAASFQSWELDITGGSLKNNYWDKMVDLRIDMGGLGDCIFISKRCFLSYGSAPLYPKGALHFDSSGQLAGFRAKLTDGFVNAKGGTTPPTNPPTNPPTDVPEPASALLMLMGGALYPLKRRFTKSA